MRKIGQLWPSIIASLIADASIHHIYLLHSSVRLSLIAALGYSKAVMSTSPAQTPHWRRWRYIAGAVSVLLGACGLAGVLCFHFPSLLTTADLRALYPIPIMRALIHIILIAAFALGVVALTFKQARAAGAIGMALALAAVALGGSQVALDDELTSGPYLGLDWLALNILGFSLLFIPLEKLFPLRSNQRVFRQHWRTDLAYFFVSHLFVQILTVLTMRPAMVLFDWARSADVQTWVQSQPAIVQFLELLILTDLVQYAVHRTFHTVPWLWRFHAVHHSIETMDWIAGSRLHLLDIVVTRGASYVPAYVLGFSEGPFFAYAAFVSIQATFIHANVRWTFGPLRYLLATPQYHHWHHAVDPVDKNFAVHLPLIDKLFGTQYLPGKTWPERYGLAGDKKMPRHGYLAQFIAPFRRL